MKDDLSGYKKSSLVIFGILIKKRQIKICLTGVMALILHESEFLKENDGENQSSSSAVLFPGEVSRQLTDKGENL